MAHTILNANGLIYVDWECQVYIKVQSLWAWAKLANEDSPAILSLGRLCHEMGYDNIWSACKQPVLVKDGVEYICETENYLPVVAVGKIADEALAEQVETDDAGGNSTLESHVGSEQENEDDSARQ